MKMYIAEPKNDEADDDIIFIQDGGISLTLFCRDHPGGIWVKDISRQSCFLRDWKDIYKVREIKTQSDLAEILI